MNKNKLVSFFFWGVLWLLCFAVLGAAAVEISAGEKVKEISSDNKITVEVDYGTLNEDEQQLKIDAKLNFKNTGNQTEDITLAASGNAGYLINLSAGAASFSLDPAALPKTVTLGLVIPVDKGAGTYELGGLKVKYGATEVSYIIQTSVLSMLKLEKIKPYVNGGHETDLEKSGDELEKLKPKDKIELRFKLENLFDRNYEEGDIEGELSLDIDEDAFELSEEEQDFDVEADKSTEVSFELEVIKEAEDGEYDLTIVLEGEDGNGAKYETKWVVALKVDRERDDVRLEEARFLADPLKCQRETELNVKIVNYGSNDQDEAALRVESRELGIAFNKVDIELESDPEGDNYFKTIIPISLADDFKPGKYLTEIWIYVDTNEEIGHEQVYLTVEDCPKKASELVSQQSCEGKDYYWYENACHEEAQEVVVAVCGNGVVELGEECDDSNSLDGDGCSSLCGIEAAVSTDGEVLETEEFDFTQVKGIVLFMGVVSVLLVIMIVLMIYVLVSGRRERD